MVRYLLLTFSFLLVGAALIAQTSIQGKITDAQSGEPILFGSVALYKNGVIVTGVETDFDGNYSISSIDPGTYDVEASYVGYSSQRIAGVVAQADKANKLDIQLSEGVTLGEVVVTDYKVPLIEQDNTSGGGTLTSEQIRQLPTKNVNALAATTAGIATSDEGGALNVRGSRSNGTNYYLDGIRVFGALPPQQDIDQLQVITGGIAANYGDVTGGIISITTKGPSSKFTGGLELETSQLFNDYNYNLATLNVAGPVLKKKSGESIIGFRLSGQYRTQDEDDPPALSVYRVSDAKLAELEAAPIIVVEGSPFPATEYVTNADVDALSARPFEKETRYDFTGKLDARLAKGLDLTISGTYNKIDNLFTPGQWGVFNSHNNPTNHTERYRTNVRLRHRLGGTVSSSEEGDDAKARKGALIQNASYTLQFGYEYNKSNVSDPRHGDNLFNYGYIGDYDLTWDPTIERLPNININNLQEILNHPFMTTTFPDSVNMDFLVSGYEGQIDYTRNFNGYTPNETINPVLTRYVLNAGDTESFDEFEVINGRVPSQFSSSWSGLHTNVGIPYNFSQKGEGEIYTFSANTSFELVPGGSEKGRHNIQFGILYEQRTSRNYSLNPFGLWTIARQLANDPLAGLALDSTNQVGTTPGFYIETMLNFNTGAFDTLAFNPIDIPVFALNTPELDGDNQFYKSIRAVTNQPLWEQVNVDGLDPNSLSLGMFSPFELNNEFNRINLNYSGYDYLGNTLDGVDFRDFFTARENNDPNGIRTFPIAAFQPNYQAAYIQDKFTFRDIIFRLGLRVDRYDANTSILKDPYSLADIMGAGQFHSENGGTKPGNIGDDFKVYLADESGTAVQAYRDGDTWYFGNGTQANSPNEIFEGLVTPKYTESDGDIRDIQSRDFNPDLTFEDYEPQINWMPRLAFSFPISDEANFFAHYDILVQRPPSNVFMSGLDYFYFATKTGIKNNPALRPERTIDYEVGFQQKLSNSSALKLAAYYRELRDMIQSRFFTHLPAPINQYETYDNLDFGTVKGFTVQYDLRRTNNVQLNISYTLQFADGTGSDANSSRSISNQGIQRALFPLNFDERHRINVVLDYRYRSGKSYNGPRWFGKDVFANAGVNLQTVAVSGRPYTEADQSNQLGADGINGAINGSRLPWNFTVNFQVDKSFRLTKPDAARALDLNVYFRVSNLLDRRNTISVYRFTGSPVDDGYLRSTRGQGALASANIPGRNLNSFLDSYQWRLLNPNNYSLPRRMYLGAIFQF